MSFQTPFPSFFEAKYFKNATFNFSPDNTVQKFLMSERDIVYLIIANLYEFQRKRNIKEAVTGMAFVLAKRSLIRI